MWIKISLGVIRLHAEQDAFFEKLYQDYFGKLTLYAGALLRNQSRAQDMVQDTFHEALRRIDILMEHPNPGGWLMVTLKNKIREEERTQRRYMLRFLSLNTDLIREPASQTPDLEEQLADDGPTFLEQIQNALTEEEFLLLKRLTIDRASHLEVAKEFGISVYASQKRLERIRKKLAKRFPDIHPRGGSRHGKE